MIDKIINFFKKIFKKEEIKLIEEPNSVRQNRNNTFKSEIKYDNGLQGKQLVNAIVSGEIDLYSKSEDEIKEISNQLINHVDNLIKRVEKCRNDLAIKRVEIEQYKKIINNKNI